MTTDFPSVMLIDDIRYVCFAAQAFVMGFPMRDDAEPGSKERIEEAVSHLLQVVGTGDENDA